MKFPVVAGALLSMFVLSQAAAAAQYSCFVGKAGEGEEESEIFETLSVDGSTENQSDPVKIVEGKLYGVCGANAAEENSAAQLYCGIVEVAEGASLTSESIHAAFEGTAEGIILRAYTGVADGGDELLLVSAYGEDQFFTYCLPAQ
jgi:hypothetical protein